MKEIKPLKIVLADDGWDKSDGQSFNVWGNVDFPPELLNYLIEYKEKTYFKYDSKTGEKIPVIDKKAPIWTAFDDFIYSNLEEIKNGKRKVPKISATFKSCFSKYGAIAENISMHIATALDMPTSYNYIVSFDPKKHQKIISNYPFPEKINKLQPYGIVSIDFLQLQKTQQPKSFTKLIEDKTGKQIEIHSYSQLEGDQLVTFKDALHKYNFGSNNLDGSENLIENWINVVDEMARRELYGVPRERVNQVINHIHSRIARSFLLKDIILGDCDFTANNGGVVINKETRKMRYAPNHDFGESFNGLIKNKLQFDPYCGMTPETFSALPKNIQDKILASKKSQGGKSVKELAKEFATPTSEQNFYYCLENFPNSSKEFFTNLDNLSRTNFIENLINEYTSLTCNGKPLLTKEEAEMFTTYLTEKIAHVSELYVKHLQSHNENIPE